MLVDVTRFNLEMTSPDELVAGRASASELDVDRIWGTAAADARSTWKRIGEAHHWDREWSVQDWAAYLSRSDVFSYFVRMRGDVAGMIELEAQPDEVVEIVTFGLLPEYIGQGIGGHALTLATTLAWNLEHRTGRGTKRVWVHTNSLDHPHALRNYQRRGFRIFRTDHVRREIPR